jgi:hypothetical protein
VGERWVASGLGQLVIRRELAGTAPRKEGAARRGFFVGAEAPTP